MSEIIVEKLGVEFFSKVSPDFFSTIQKAVDQFNQQIQPSLKAIASQFKAIGASVSTFFELLKSVPAGDIFKGWNVQGATDKMSASFKTAKDQSLKYVEELSTGIKAKLRDLEREFAKNQKIISSLQAGEDIVTSWGQPKWSTRKKKMYFPNAQWAVGSGGMREGVDYPQGSSPYGADTDRVFSEVSAGYQSRQLTIYKEMESVLGRMGAFERARLATDELIARANQSEVDAKSKIAEVSKIIDVLRSKGLTVEGKDDKYFSSAKKHLEDIWNTTKDINILNQEAEAVIARICGSEEALKKIILERFEIEGKLVTLATSMANEYERAKASQFQSLNVGGLWTKGDINVESWQRLIGYVEQARGAVNAFQQNIQAVQMKAFIDPNELERINRLTSVLNAEIDSLSNRLSKIGSQTGAKAIAEPFVALEAQITKVETALAAAQASGKGGAVVYTNLDATVRKLANDLKELAASTKLWRVDEIRAGMGVLDAQINKLSGGAELSYKSLKKMGMGMLEVEEIQSLLGTKMKLIREEFALTGVATTAMNTEMNKSSQAMVGLRAYAGEVEKKTGDAARAMQRWSIEGFGNMLKSQMAWLVGGALIFGTIFKIQQAFREATSTLMKFSQAIIDVGAITNASAGDMKVLEKAARDVATTTKMSFLEAADALKILGQAGLTAKQSADALKTVGMMVSATGASAQEAVKILTTSMYVWNISAKDVTRIGNVLAAALNYSKLEVGDLTTSFNYLAATASQVGMGIEETAATIAVLSNAGLRASTIGTGLRGILGQLIAPTKAFRDELHSIGVDFEAIRMPGHNLIEVLGVLGKAGFDLTNTFEGLEKRQAGVFAAMSNMGKDAFQKMTDALTGTNALLVMNERAMQGPMAQLHVFKTSLLDVALSTSDIVVPSFNLLLKVLGELVATFKLLWPVFIGGAVISGIQYLIKQFDLLALGAGTLNTVLTFLGKHPIFLALSLLAAAVTAVKLAYGGLHQSNEDRIKQIDREVLLYIQQVQELEQLKIKVLDLKISDDELRTSVNNLSGEYSGLKEMVNQVGFSHGAVKDKIIADINEMYKAIDSLKFDRLKLLLDDLETLHKKIDKTKDKLREVRSMQPSGEFDLLPVNTRSEELKLIDRLTDLTEKEIKLKQAAIETGRAYKNRTEDELRALAKEKEFSEAYLKVALDTRKQAIQEDVDAAAKSIESGMQARLSSMRSAANEMKKALADERGKLALTREDELAKFPEKGYADTETGRKAAQLAAEQRKLVWAKYYDEIGKLDEKERYQEIQFNFRVSEEEYRQALQLASKTSDMEVRIQKETHFKILLEILDFQKKMADIANREMMKQIKPEGAGRERGVAQAEFAKRTLLLREQEAVEIANAQAKQRERDAAKEVEYLNWTRRLKEEDARARIAIAKTVGKDVEAQQEATNIALERLEEEHTEELKKIELKYQDEWGLITFKGMALQAEEEKAYQNKRIGIVEQGRKNIEQAQDQWNQKELEDIRKRMKAQTDEETKGMRDQLKNLQVQYDNLDKATRESEFGQNLKNQIDGIMITIDEANKKVLEWGIKMAEALPNQTYSTAAAISQLRQDFEQLTDKVRAARREMTDWADKHGSLLKGMEAGLKEFSTSLDGTFDVGRKSVVDFGKALYDSTGGVLNDLMTHEMKNWKDYWLNLLKSIGQNFSKMINGMIWDFIGFKKATEAGGFDWGKLLGGIFGGGGGGVSATGAGQFEGVDWGSILGSAVHQGGFPRYHSGGLGRDEILALLLKKEYVLRPQATQSIGKDRLDYMNATGQIPGGQGTKSKIEVEVRLEPGLLASVRPSADEIDLTVATKYRMGGELYKQLQGSR